jgi:hypothetical protein
MGYLERKIVKVRIRICTVGRKKFGIYFAYGVRVGVTAPATLWINTEMKHFALRQNWQ